MRCTFGGTRIGSSGDPPVDTTGVSPSLDRLRDAHAGAGKGGDSSLLHDAPPEVAAFGAVYGHSCGLVWGHTGRDWDRLSDLAGSWVDRALEEHERAQVPAAVQEDSRGLRVESVSIGSAPPVRLNLSRS